MNYDQTISTAPYNTMNLPAGEKPNLNNPQIKSNINYEVNNFYQSGKYPLESVSDFYDPTSEMVDNYLKNNTTMYDNIGKYYDQYLFNQKFDNYIRQKNKERLLKEKVQLYDLDSIENIQVQPYELPINKLLINFKNVWFELFDDVIQKKDPTNLFTTTNFFYFGITFIVIFLLYIMLSYIFT